MLTKIIFDVIIISNDKRRGREIKMSIKIMREKAKITQSKLAELLNTRQSTISMWETGESLPRADKLLQLAELLSCTVDDLLRTETEEQDQKTGT